MDKQSRVACRDMMLMRVSDLEISLSQGRLSSSDSFKCPAPIHVAREVFCEKSRVECRYIAQHSITSHNFSPSGIGTSTV